jgi:YD repeat-containing protein
LVETHVDREGVETSFAYDALDRVIATTRNGITEIQTLDPVGRLLARTRQGTDGSQVVLERNTYDRAGRLIANADVRTGPTIYVYALDGVGQRIVTATFADGGQKIETYAADGRLVKLTGSATRPVRYGNDVEIESGVNREIRYEVKLDAAGNDTSEWVKVFRDMLGRNYKRQYADGAAEFNFYNAKGQLWKRQDADGVVNLQAYNELGEVEYTAVDFDRNDQIDLAGRDQVTRTLREVVKDHGVTVRRTQTWVWPENGQDTPVTSSTTEAAVEGQHSWNTQNGLTRETATSDDGQGNRVVTVTSPNGT